MNRCIIVPARKGSKRCPGKNLRLYRGKPLLWWAIDKALSLCIDEWDRVFLTTDYPVEEIVEAGVLPPEKYDEGGDLIFYEEGRKLPLPLSFRERSPWLATDEAPMLPVVVDALSGYLLNDETDVDEYLVIVIYPSFPDVPASVIEAGIQAANIDGGVGGIGHHRYSAVISGYDPSPHPALIYPMQTYGDQDSPGGTRLSLGGWGNGLTNLADLSPNSYYRSQDYPKNGYKAISHAVCAFRLDAIYQMNNQLLVPGMYVYPIDQPKDVDLEEDFEL